MVAKGLNPDDPLLDSPHAPHEVSAVLRMHRAGWPSALIATTFGMRGSKLVNALTKGMHESQLAERANRPVHQVVLNRKEE